MTNEQFIDKFIKLCSFNVDYGSKTSVKKYNKNMKKLAKMEKEISTKLDIAANAYSILLKNNNVIVSTVAAAHCLRLGLLKDEAIEVLKRTSRSSNIGIISLSAETCLKNYGIT